MALMTYLVFVIILRLMLLSPAHLQPASGAPPSGDYLYADFEESDDSDGKGLFNDIKSTTSGSDGTSQVSRSTDWSSHGSYGAKLSTAWALVYTAFVKENGTGGSSDFDIYMSYRHKASQNEKAGVCWGADWDTDPDYVGGILLWYDDAGNDLWLSAFETDGVPKNYSETDVDVNIGALTDGAKYTLHLSISITGGTATITGEMLDSTDTQIASVSGSVSTTGMTDDVAFMIYSQASASGNEIIADEMRVVVND